MAFNSCADKTANRIPGNDPFLSELRQYAQPVPEIAPNDDKVKDNFPINQDHFLSIQKAEMNRRIDQTDYMRRMATSTTPGSTPNSLLANTVNSVSNGNNITPPSVQTIRGADGLNGIDGRPGRDGKDGKDGKDGERGPRGPPGLPGQNGVNGLNGEPGETKIVPCVDCGSSNVSGVPSKPISSQSFGYFYVLPQAGNVCNVNIAEGIEWTKSITRNMNVNTANPSQIIINTSNPSLGPGIFRISVTINTKTASQFGFEIHSTHTSSVGGNPIIKPEHAFGTSAADQSNVPLTSTFLAQIPNGSLVSFVLLSTADKQPAIISSASGGSSVVVGATLVIEQLAYSNVL